MSTTLSPEGDAVVSVENIGGIRETVVEFSPGTTLLVGRNATNRTSFLQSVMAGLGSKKVSINGDADEARVELKLGDETYTQRLRRESGGIVAEGDSYLDEPEPANLFAFLLESNEARRAIVTGADLRELIMRPVDTEEIETEIRRLAEERERLEGELSEIEELKGELPELESKRSRLRSKIEETASELQEKEQELEATDRNLETTREEKSELDEKLDQLRAKRSSLEDIRYDLETERESLEMLERERRELETEYEDLPETPAGEIEELNADIRQLRERKQRLDSEISTLQSVIGFNEEMLESADSEAFAALRDGTDEAVTDRLLDDEVVCWTCGSEVERDQIERIVDSLQELSQSKVQDVNDLEDEIDELQSSKRELETAQRERERIEQRLESLEAEAERQEETIEELQTRRESLREEIEVVETEVETLEDADHQAVLDLHREANQLEHDLGRLESDLERVDGRIADVEARIADQSDIEARLEELDEETADLRTKIERVERTAVEKFNDHMDSLLELLGYRNLERIWLERTEREAREGRRKVQRSVFDLHVVRKSESGAVYEDTVEHLSESEREVTGLVFALAGYLAHEVHDTVPFILLDSLEAIDSERIATLVAHLEEYASYLLVALLPEDAAAFPEEYDRITDI
jgi:chromosome segregation ATPase